MSDSFEISALVRATFREPRKAADVIRTANLSRQALWLMFWLIVVLSTMFQIIVSALIVLPAESGLTLAPVRPAVAAFDAALLNGMMVYGLWKGGEVWGGRGTFQQTAAIYLYLQGVGFTALLAMFIIVAVVPPLLWLVPFVIGGLLIWINLCFIDQLHGFGSLGKSLGLIIVVWVGLFLLQAIFSTLTGGLAGS